MKAAVEQYAKGDFQFDRPGILISEQKLDLRIEAGTVYHGVLALTNVQDARMKVMVYDDRYLFTFDRHIFVERKCELHYHFDGSHYEQGKTIRGNLNVITDGGEFVVPYTVEIVAPYVETSLGPVNDMFQFTSLAEQSWGEALRVFESEDFERTFLKGQPQLEKVYDSLRVSLSANQALEEFLVYMHKKKVQSLSVVPEVISMEMPETMMTGSVRITRNTWGYTNASIYTDCPFVIVRKQMLTSEDFYGDEYNLEFLVNPELMEEEDRIGHIFIENIYQKLKVEFLINRGFSVKKERTESMAPRRIVKASIVRLVKSYIDLRIGRMDSTQYIERTLFTLQNLVQYQPEVSIYRLGVLHMQLLTGEKEYVEQECMRMEADDVAMIHGERESCYYQYIKAMLTKEPAAVRRVAEMVQVHLGAEKPDLFYYWLYMHVAAEFREDKTALYRQMERLYEAGMRSPIMYLEVCDMFNQEPMMFRKLGDLELSAIHWGIRQDYVSTELKQSYVLLAAREKGFSKKIFRTLVAIYEESKSVDCLKAMVTMLITGNRLERKYHQYYALAVDASLKLIGLNECFLRSMDFKEYDRIPFPVLKYLNYKNTLTEKETAYLYANIIVNKDDYVNVYHEYIGNIEAFMGEQILKGNIDDDLSVIYAEFLDPGQVSEKYAFQLINIIFKRKLICQNKRIRSVAIKHRELDKEVIVQVHDGVAYVELITDSAAISLLDENGNRYISTIPYRLEKLVEERYYVDICCRYSPHDYRLLLYLHANAKKLMGQNIQEINLARELIHKKELSVVKRQEALVTMITYYDSHYDSAILQKYLAMVDEFSMLPESSTYLIELMIQEGLYKKAYSLMQIYGFANVQDEKLLKLVSYLTNEPENMHDEMLTAICARLFEHDKYGEAVLKHLTNHYRGTLDELCTLWKRSRGILSDTRELEENALAQMMFTDQICDEIYDLFSSYYYGRNRGMVVKGFLKQTAFRYVVGGAVVPTHIFDTMYNEVDKGNLSDDLTAMALLMYFSTMQVHPSKVNWVKEKVTDFIKRGKILPFFKQFAGLVDLPVDVYCKTYLIYRSKVHENVKVQYSFDSVLKQQLYIPDQLEEILPGLYVKSFVVFRGERLLYHLDAPTEGTAVIVESDASTTDQMMGEPENRFAWINEMLRYQELQDDDMLLEEISRYLHVLHLFDDNLKML